MPMTTERVELLTPQAVGEWLGVSVNHLATWRYTNTGPAFTRIGRAIRYDRASVEAFIDAGRVQTGV